jgi:hypothetical protein
MFRAVSTTICGLHRGHLMFRAVSRTPMIREMRVRFQINPCRICRGHSGGGTGFSPGTPTLTCSYYSTNIPHPSLSLYKVSN